MTARPSRLFAICAVAGALALTGCSGDEPGSGTSDSSVSDAGSDSAAQDVEYDGATAAGLDRDDLPTAIATQTIGGDVDSGVQTVKVDLLKVKRVDKIVKVVFAVTPTLVASDKTPTLHDGMNGARANVSLLDPVNLKLYRTLKADSDWLASDLRSVVFTEGKPSFVWAVVAAPPEDVTEVTVTLLEGTEPFTGVPIS